MNGILFFLCCFLAVYFFFVGKRETKREERQALREQIELEAIEQEKRQRRFTTPLQYALELASQAGMKPSRSEWLITLISFAFVGALLPMFRGNSILGVLVGALVGLALPFVYLRWKKSKHSNAFRYGLVDFTEIGISLFGALPDFEGLVREGAKSKNSVIAQECKEILRETEVLGTTALNVALRRAKASSIQEYQVLLESTRISLESNSSLVEVYKDINGVLKDFFDNEKMLLAKTSGMRKVGFVFAGLSISSFFFLWGSLIQPLMDRWFVATAFYATCAVILFGIYLLNRVVKINV